MTHPAATLPTMGGKIRLFTVALALTATALAGCSSPDSPVPSVSGTASSSSEESINGGEALDVPDPYTQPADLKGFLAGIKPSLVLIVCGKYYGSGWVIDTASPPVIRPGIERTFKPEQSSLVITNDHIIRPCIKNARRKFYGLLKEREVNLEILNFNRKDDVALLAMDTLAAGLQATRKPDQGTWAVAVGFPLDFRYPVPVMGSVIDALNESIVLQMPTQPGNSGSPVLNADGKVTGTMSIVYLDGEGGPATGWTKASSNQTLCLHLFDCTTAPITQAGE